MRAVGEVAGERVGVRGRAMAIRQLRCLRLHFGTHIVLFVLV